MTALTRCLARCLSVALVLLVLTGASRAVAAKPKAVESSATAEARRHFEVGLTLLKEKNFSAALGEFRESYAMAGRPSALRNMAQCQREMHQFAAAFASLERLLATHGTDVKRPDKLAIQRAIEELRQLTAIVDVRVTPAGADVFVDGEKLGQTPLEHYRIDSGIRKLRVQKMGFDPLERDVEVVSMKDSIVTAALAPEVTTGRLVVRESSGLALTVFVDGKSVGITPFEGDFQPGAHAVEARSDVAGAKPRTVEVAKKGRVEVVLEAAPLMARLRVTVTPSTATLRVDGQRAVSGAFDQEVTLGRHAVVIEAVGFERAERYVDVRAGDVVTHEVVLVALPDPGPAPPVAAPYVAPEPDYVGLYSQLGLHFAYGLTPPSPACAATSTCTPTDPMGGASSLRLGYSTGVVGFEAAVAGQFDSRADGEKFAVGSGGVQRSFLTMRGFVGGGIRIITPGTVRFTIGATPGYSMQSYSLTNQYETGSTYRANASNSCFGMLLDAAFVIGASPGTKVIIGATAWADFLGQPVSTAPGSYTDAGRAKRDEPAYQVAPSMNWIVMPTFGFQFGH